MRTGLDLFFEHCAEKSGLEILRPLQSKLDKGEFRVACKLEYAGYNRQPKETETTKLCLSKIETRGKKVVTMEPTSAKLVSKRLDRKPYKVTWMILPVESFYRFMERLRKHEHHNRQARDHRDG